MSIGKLIAGLVLTGALVTPSPAEAAAQYPVMVTWYWDGIEKGYPALHVDVARADTFDSLRYIRVCLQRMEDTGWDTRSCHKTDAYGSTKWLLYEGREYRIHVPPTQYHYPTYSEPFVS